jgi:hypothetical protein
MEAAIYNLDDMRSQRRTATPTAATLCLRLMADGLAASLSAQSFFAQYAVAVSRFHVAMLNAGCSPSLKPTKSEDAHVRW